jgi:dTDP-4-amino-4,6-dideoxygalactose transaminase
MFSKDKDLQHKLFYSHNFGHNGPLDFYGLGINAKISELQSAMGLAVLPYMETIISERKKVVEYYNENLDFTKVSKMKLRAGTDWNYSYYPIFFKDEESLLRIQQLLNDHQIVPRRYFNPSLNTINYVDYKEMQQSENISKCIICLPLFVGLSIEEVKKICNLINCDIN